MNQFAAVSINQIESVRSNQTYAVCMIAYHEHGTIRACLKQFPKWIDKIVVLASELPWHGLKAPHDGKMIEAIKKRKGEDERIDLIKLNWRTEEEQRNWGLGYLYAYDWVLVIDADEFFTPEDWERLHEKLDSLPLSVFTAATDNMLTYWKTWDYIWEPRDGHKPVIAIRPKSDVFYDKRCSVAQSYFILPIPMHHLSWTKNDEDVQQKLSNWGHANDFDTKKWYDEVWKQWTPEKLDMKGLRPYGSEHPETQAVYSPLPDSIKALFSDV